VGGVAMSIGLWLLPAAAPAQPAAACPPPPDLSVVARTRPGEGADHGLLWRAEKEGRALWLYGTLHVAKLAWAFPGPAQRDALARSDTLALELDLLDPTLQARMAQALAAQPKVTLPAALQARLDRQAQAECLPRQAIAALAPDVVDVSSGVEAAPGIKDHDRMRAFRDAVFHAPIGPTVT
jgi:hypothetical protein